ncbi:hypothetical protein SAMN04488516_102271 [Desulfonauticus submarinus]|uniref:Uncharacterized protein n=1 Tax=Desulfonauticus submarinus TaxID=206665 RepID=A0A1H0BRX1_9BACT|nr:hypothetical protein [Desulfonauticus submarinus]SDN48419.1 hypothetical protein SAMN04488516_102271 [Desulfonauticus submarinus]
MKKELKSKLRNCLETILEFEDALGRFNCDFDLKLNSEMDYIKDFLSKLDDIELEDSELIRIEESTSRFLLEIKDLVQQKIKPKRDIQ